MLSAKDRITELVRSQADDASFDDILQALAIERMVLLGLDDSRQGRVISNEEMKRQIDSWQP